MTTPEAINPEDKMETPYVTMWMEDKILCARYADNLHVTLEVAKYCVERRLMFSKGKSYPILLDMKGVKSTTSDAREYLATIGTTLVTASALITGSLLNTAIGNIFLTIDKPPIPVKLFSNEEKARAWLAGFI